MKPASPTGVTHAVTGLTYPVPDGLYSPLDTTGLLYLQSSGILPTVVNPATYSQEAPTYSVWGNEITLSSQPTQSELVIRYFAYYPHPSADSDTIDIPQWGLTALAYQMGALAMSPIAVQSANIRQ